ncbi:MAG: phenylalanine--tRNA ligase subunit beta [Candidatus Levybacteria bacterium]|nr:phenylalanine--tRNA ligase subunit beta [Candidatus Levybacteria bacterium]
MNIKILDSWLREYLKTKASGKTIADLLSLTSVSVERLEKYGKNDLVYDIEITTNRPDLMSVVGIAREASTVLQQFDHPAEFIPHKVSKPPEPKEKLPITIKNNPKLVGRITAVIMSVDLKQSPQYIKDRLEASGIRSINNLIDVTNYVMRETGHPTHVFDYDRLTTKRLEIRESEKGESLITLDDKTHILKGGDIIADDGAGKIVDLLGVMGTKNSVVTDNTKRILFFIDNCDPDRIRKTSMSLNIRSEAAVLNEKGIDLELAANAMLRGIELFREIANGQLLSNIIDIYPHKSPVKKIEITEEKINNIIGIKIPLKTSGNILKKLGFDVIVKANGLSVAIPSWRNNDIDIPEDIVEEIARIYGYHQLPSILPPLYSTENYQLSKDSFYWEKRIKESLKYWGFTEVYTYSMVSEDLLEGPTNQAASIANPLTEDMVYLRKTLTPGLLRAIRNNPTKEEIKIFELANIYMPKPKDLPKETLMLSGIIKKQKISFYETKGIVEQLLNDVGIKNISFEKTDNGGLEISVKIGSELLGNIEVLDENISDFELNFETIEKHANLTKIYKEIPKYPPVIEDVSLEVNPDITYENICSAIKNQSELISEISLIDTYQNTKTFRIKYQDYKKTLTNEEVSKIREKVLRSLKDKFNAIPK